ncbi:MAG: pilus assembly PilX N-terminal domain-containing protein [Candidatus Acidiferrales bacterium]
MRTETEKGVALITSLLVMVMISAIIVGMCWMVMTDQRLGGNNKSRESAFYGAEAGMEQLTASVANVFNTKGSLSAADIATITSTPPTGIPYIQYINAAGASTYNVSFIADPLTGNPASTYATILPPSPYAGMQGLITPYTLSVAAQNSTTGSEVKLLRTLQLVTIPVFQFGVYSDSDLSFFAGPPFTFGGRTHTNGNLWLAANAGPLFLSDKVTAVGQIIRTNLVNGNTIAAGNYDGIVTIATTPNPPLPPGPSYANSQWRPLGLNEGSVNAPSVVGAVSTSLNNPTWSNLMSSNVYNGQLTNNAPLLTLTSTALGANVSPITLIRRPLAGGGSSGQMYSLASVRILLDDYGTAGCTNADMMSLPGITATTPIDLATLSALNGAPPASATWYNPILNTAGMAIPLPVSDATVAIPAVYSSANGYWITNGSPTITGCIKIEIQAIGGGWTDVTQAVLNRGFTGRNINPTNTTNYIYTAPPALLPLPNPAGNPAAVAAQGPTTNANVAATVPCTDPSPSAIIRLARLRDNPQTNTANGCGTPSLRGTDYWPMALYDTREGIYRPEQNPAAPNSLDYLPGGAQPGVTGAGVMNYVELDVAQLANWITTSGLSINNANNGFTVYFSDRRGEQKDPSSGNVRTGSFGYNELVNSLNPATGCPDGVAAPTPGVPEQGEDLEGDSILRTYGGLSMTPANVLGGMGAGPFKPNCGNINWPGYVYNYTQEARENSPALFRRALKIVDGATINLGLSCGAVPCGLTIASENPVYIQGDYNAPADGSWSGSSVAASVVGDTVTLLSDNWNDVNTFMFPYNLGGRTAVQTAYRVALIAGKGIPFPQPAGQPNDFGTDGGVHNFLRFLENWPVSCYYQGSLVSFYYNRQGVGTYKTGNYVYSPPDRHYSFDTNFTLGPAYLPPNTPQLRSVDTTGFSQEILPTQ